MKIIVSPSAAAELARLPRADQLRIDKKLHFYQEQKDPLKFAKRLKGFDAYRFRVGDYRIIFTIESNTVYILVIAKRDGAYKDI